MAAKDYKARRRTTVKLHDGTVVTIRRLNVKDFLQDGNVPDVLFDEKAIRSDVVASISDKKNLYRLYKVAFLRGVLPTPDFVPVDKMPGECAENEICIDDLIDADQLQIFLAATMGGVGGDNAQMFPGEPQKQEASGAG